MPQKDRGGKSVPQRRSERRRDPAAPTLLISVSGLRHSNGPRLLPYVSTNNCSVISSKQIQVWMSHSARAPARASLRVCAPAPVLALSEATPSISTCTRHRVTFYIVAMVTGDRFASTYVSVQWHYKVCWNLIYRPSTHPNRTVTVWWEL